MKSTVRLAVVGGLAAAATALLASPGLAAARHQAGRPSGEVYVQTDNTGGNAVVVYDRAANGTLRQAGAYPAGGLGGVLAGSAVDHLASEGSLVYDDGLLYAVNAGSNTITVFSAHGDRLIRRQVIGSGGTFPVSVAVRGRTVYVLNARDGGSVQGFLRAGRTLVRVPAWHRALGLNPAETPEFTSTPGQVVFSPDGTKLIVTTKNNGNDIDVFAVNAAGRLSARPVVTADPGAVPFGVAFDAGGHLVVTEAGPNALATFTVHRDGALTLVGRVATGQAGTCWVTGTGAAFYASNAGSGSLSGYADAGSGALRPLGHTATDPGTVDAAASPGPPYLYAQTGANGIVDEFAASAGGSLARIGSVTVPGAAGGEGIAAS
jgi:DNA-binding beta-propeller fold protein YncE